MLFTTKQIHSKNTQQNKKKRMRRKTKLFSKKQEKMKKYQPNTTIFHIQQTIQQK